MARGVSRYAGLIAVAAVFIAAVLLRGESLSDPAARRELIYCSIAIISAVIINWGIDTLTGRRIRTTLSYIGWILVSLSIALKSADPVPFFDFSSGIGLAAVFTAGVVILLWAYLGRAPDR
ncbi:MAG: hypothetical protein R6U43_10985 [Candidatus Krumholzibacteriales bacterium]